MYWNKIPKIDKYHVSFDSICTYKLILYRCESTCYGSKVRYVGFWSEIGTLRIASHML